MRGLFTHIVFKATKIVGSVTVCTEIMLQNVTFTYLYNFLLIGYLTFMMNRLYRLDQILLYFVIDFRSSA